MDYKKENDEQVKIQLKQSEEKFRTLFNSASDAIFIHDLEGKFMEVNDVACKRLGYSREEFLQMTPLDIDLPVYAKNVKENLSKLIEQGYHVIETVHVAKDKRLIPSEINAKIFNYEGKRAVLSIARDISLRKDIQQTINESEGRYRSLFQDSYSVMLLIEPITGNIIDANKAALDYYGYSYQELVLKNINEINILATSEIKNKMLDVVNDKEKHFYFQHKLASGEIRDVEVYSGKITMSQKVFIYSLVHDITDRKKAEKSLIEKEAKLRKIFNGSSNAIFITNQEGCILEVNDTAFELTGLNFPGLQGKSIHSIISLGNDNVGEKNLRIEGFLKAEKFFFGTTIRHNSGKSIPIEVKTSIIENNGKLLYIFFVNDISERQQMQAKILRTILETEERERKRFARDLHDGINSVLSTINLYLDLLKLDDISRQERISMINESIDLIKDAINGAREIANNLQPSHIDRFGFISALKSFCEKINSTGTLNINLVIKNDHLQFNKNVEVTLYRIVQEMMNNTIKHSSAKNVKIDLGNDGKNVFLIYQDDGVGFNLEQVVEGEERGAGITNMMSRVKSLNGTFEIHSKKGQGMAAKITFDIY